MEARRRRVLACIRSCIQQILVQLMIKRLVQHGGVRGEIVINFFHLMVVVLFTLKNYTPSIS
jgi:hypothetical protein